MDAALITRVTLRHGKQAPAITNGPPEPAITVHTADLAIQDTEANRITIAKIFKEILIIIPVAANSVHNYAAATL